VQEPTQIAGAEGELEDVLVIEREHWVDGPPHELFKQMRGGCPVHWTSEVTEIPEAAGFWSVTRAEDVHAVSRDWQTYSSELGGVVAIDEVFPIELARAMFIGMDPPKHDRLKALFQAGFTPKRIAAHEEAIRAIVIDVLDRLEGRETCDLVTDVAQPAVSRVIGSFMGIPEEDDATWAELMNTALAASDPDYSPDGAETIEEVIQKAIAEIFARCSAMIAERRENPTDDLTSVLVHAEVEGEMLEDHEIVMGFFLLVAAGNDSTKATYSSAMRALMENPDQRQLLLEDPARIPGAVEEALRMFPAFAHFRRTATKDTELNGTQIKAGDKVVMWYASSNRDETRFEDPDRFDVLRNPDHQAFGAGGRHFCLGTALARLELNILLEETLARYPDMKMAGDPVYIESGFLNQLKTLPVRLGTPA
jgi:cholest-4-en-3-one 26-monooxygenase